MSEDAFDNVLAPVATVAEDQIGTWVDLDALEAELGREAVAPLKTLGPTEKSIINLHLDGGCTMAEIGRRVGKSTNFVACVLRDPLVASVLEQIKEDNTRQFEYLQPLVTKALREGLTHEDIAVKLAASRIWGQAMAGRISTSAQRGPSAEELIAKLAAVRARTPSLGGPK